jgi:hypothetical protein
MSKEKQVSRVDWQSVLKVAVKDRRLVTCLDGGSIRY